MRSSSAPSRKQHHPSSTSPSSGGSVRAQAQDSSTQSACSCTVHESCTCTEGRHEVQPNGIHFPTRKTSAAQGNGCSLLTPLLCPFCLRDPMLSAGTCTANQQSVAEDSFRIVYRTARVLLRDLSLPLSGLDSIKKAGTYSCLFVPLRAWQNKLCHNMPPK